MECNQAGLPLNRKMHRSDIAVADEYFRVLPNQVVVDSVQQLPGAIAAANRKHTPTSDRKTLMKIVEPLLDVHRCTRIACVHSFPNFGLSPKYVNRPFGRVEQHPGRRRKSKE